MELRWLSSKAPVYMSTNPSDLNPSQLQLLCATCNHFPQRYPKLAHRPSNSSRLPEAPPDLDKLRLAISRSAVVVSVFTDSRFNSDGVDNMPLGLGNLLQRVKVPIPIYSPPRELVGFGRAVSDMGLTASLYDVMVLPSFRRRGIGRMIVRKILSMLTRRDIYDIAALCSPDQRPFFAACGFGDDILGSVTMMHTDANFSVSEC